MEVLVETSERILYIKKEITKLSAHYEENDSKIAQGMGNKMWKNVSYK